MHMYISTQTKLQRKQIRRCTSPNVFRVLSCHTATRGLSFRRPKNNPIQSTIQSNTAMPFDSIACQIIVSLPGYQATNHAHNIHTYAYASSSSHIMSREIALQRSSTNDARSIPHTANIIPQTCELGRGLGRGYYEAVEMGRVWYVAIVGWGMSITQTLAGCG
jgi:hypothetical protein